MGLKLLWTGLVFILALTPALEVLGVHPSSVVIVVGAVLMMIGCVLLWLEK